LLWGQKPNWFFDLNTQEQETLLALYRIEHETQEERKERRQRYDRGLICQKSNTK